MEDLLIRHRTSYRYQVPVQLGPHRLMLRPRESCEVRLKTFDINILPASPGNPRGRPVPTEAPVKRGDCWRAIRTSALCEWQKTGISRDLQSRWLTSAKERLERVAGLEPA